MGFLGYIAGSLIAPSFAGHLISKGLNNYEEKSLVQEIEDKVSAFNRKFDDTEVDSNYFVEFLEQREVCSSIIDRVFHAYKTSKDDYDSLSKDLAKEAIGFVNFKKDKFKHPHVKREKDFVDYFNELFGVLVDFRESLLSIKGKAIVSTIDESINKVEENISRRIDALCELGTITCDELNKWYMANTKNKCTLELFNHENKEFVNKLLNKLNENVISIRGENVLEVVAYVAYIFLNDERYSGYKERLLIVEDEQSWNKLSRGNFSNYIFINRFNNNDNLQLIENNKCIFVYGKNDYAKSADILELEKRFFRNLIDKVIQCGFEHQEAYEISVASRNNYTILMRQLFLGKQKEPVWANVDMYNKLLPAMIINQWIDKDAVFFELLFDNELSYDDYMKELSAINDNQDPFFVVYKTWYNNKKYIISDAENAWSFFECYIDDSLFEKLEPLIELIFSEIDPKFNLPTDQHSYARVLGYLPQFSDELRNGFIETLIYLSRPESKISKSIKKKVEELIAKVENQKEWFAISEVLPLIFEINPEAVISKFELELKKEDSGMLNLFYEKSDDFFFGRSYYTHVIWTLEKALYCEDYVYRSIIILSKLMDFDIEYRMSNSPINTLYNSLVAWRHEYIYTIDDKIEYVRYIMENSKRGWELLEKLLPSNNSGIVSNLNKPKFTSFLLSDELKYERQICDTYLKYYSIAFDNINRNIDNLCVFYENALFFNFGVYEKLKNITYELLVEFSDEEKYKLYKKVFKLISRHRRFSNAELAIKEEFLVILENEILDKIVFNDESFKYQYFFESYGDILLNPVVFEENDSHDYIKENQRLEDELRKNSINELVKFNIDWCEFISRFDKKASNSIGLYLAEVKNDITFIEEISICLFSEKNLSILTSYYGSLYLIFGLEIVDLFMDSEVLNSEKYLELMFSRINVDKNAMEYLSNLEEGYKEIFWKIKTVVYNVKEDVKDFALDNYIKYKNANALIELASQYNYNTDKLINVLEIVKESSFMHHHMDSYHIERIFNKIYEESFPNEEISQEIMNLEIYFSPIISDKNMFKYLKYNLSKEPLLSADFIKFLYKSEKENDNKVLDEKGKRLAEILFSLLSSVKFSPSNNGIGLIDYNRLKEWCEKYISFVTGNNQRTIGLQYLGHFLANTNKVKEDEYPQESVKQVIEEIYDEELEKGFVIETSNGIGVRTISDGAYLLNLAIKYNDYAQDARMYPKTYKILKNISNDFYREYQLEKESAKYE